MGAPSGWGYSLANKDRLIISIDNSRALNKLETLIMKLNPSKSPNQLGICLSYIVDFEIGMVFHNVFESSRVAQPIERATVNNSLLELYIMEAIQPRKTDLSY